VGTNCTTNPEQIEIVELEGHSPLMYNELCASSHDAFDRSIGDVVQARPSTSFVDNAIDLPWRNFLSPEFAAKFQREVPEFPFNTV